MVSEFRLGLSSWAPPGRVLLHVEAPNSLHTWGTRGRQTPTLGSNMFRKRLSTHMVPILFSTWKTGLSQDIRWISAPLSLMVWIHDQWPQPILGSESLICQKLCFSAL